MRITMKVQGRFVVKSIWKPDMVIRNINSSPRKLKLTERQESTLETKRIHSLVER